MHSSSSIPPLSTASSSSSSSSSSSTSSSSKQAPHYYVLPNAIPSHGGAKTQTPISKMKGLFANCKFEQKGSAYTITPLQSSQNTAKQTKLGPRSRILRHSTSMKLGQHTWSLPSELASELKKCGLFSFPDYLTAQMQLLPKRYQFMTLSDLIIFSFLKTTEIYCQSTDFADYFRDSTIVISMILGPLNKRDLPMFTKMIRHLHSTGYKDLVPLLCASSKYIQNLTGEMEELQISDELKRPWGIPARTFDLASLFERGADVTKADISHDLLFNVCLLPSIMNNYKMMLSKVIQSTLIRFEETKELFKNFMTEFFSKIEKRNISITDVQDYLKVHPDDPAGHEIAHHLAVLITNQSSEFNISRLSPSAQALVSVLQRRISPSCQSITAPLIEFLDLHLLRSFEELEAIYEVDIQEYVEMFSATHGDRIFQDGNDDQAREIVLSRIEELIKISKSTVKIHDQIYQISNLWTNLSYAFLLYPTWYWVIGENCKPSDYMSSYNSYQNAFMASVGGIKRLNEHTKISIESIVLDYPELADSIEKLEKSVVKLTEGTRSLCRHTAALKEQCSSILETGSILRTKILEENAQIEKEQLKQNADAAKRSELQRELIEEEEIQRQLRKKRDAKMAVPRGSQPNDPPSVPLSQSPPDLATSSSSSPESTHLSITSAASTFNPLEMLLMTLASGCSRVCFKNTYAQRAWRNAAEQFNDLSAELQDRINFQDPKQVAEHVNRLLVILSLLMEQILSAHLLENREPKNRYELWKMLRHNSDFLLEQSKLSERVSELPSLLPKVSNLATLSRSPYAVPLQTSCGAQLLYQAEELSSTQNPHLITPVLEGTYSLLKEMLQLVNRLALPDQELSLTGLDQFLMEPPGATIKRERDPLHDLIERALSFLPKEPVLLSDEINPLHHLADAKRHLELIYTRLERGIHGGNIRNLYKTLNTFIPLAIKSLAMAGAKAQGLPIQRPEAMHNLMEWCEQLKFFNHTPEMRHYLYASGNIHKYIRNPALYDKNIDDSRILHDLAKVNKHTTAGLDRESQTWIVPKADRLRLKFLLNECRENSKIGLDIFIQLAQFLNLTIRSSEL